MARKQSNAQRVFWIVSLIVVLSMMAGFLYSFTPPRQSRTTPTPVLPTPFPTRTPTPTSTSGADLSLHPWLA